MPDRFLVKIAAPMAAVSLLLLGLGAVAAWNVQLAERTNEASRVTSEQLRWGFLLLGVCGGAGGLIGGLAIARAVSRSIVQLEVSVRSAEGKLIPIAGPVRISRVGGFRELETGLARIESH